MPMGFHLYKDNAGEFRWYFEASNGRKIADSGEGYKSKQHCIDGMQIIAATNGNTPFYDHTPK